MFFSRVTLENCRQAAGVVVVIDVLRAFTTAAFALHEGAARIIPVSGHEEALALRDAIPGSFVLGEIDGLPPPGFDFGNSPTEMVRAGRERLNGRTLIQRTSAGTQGVVGTAHADTVFVSSFVVAQATAATIRRLAPSQVTFVITGRRDARRGDEDEALADYLEALLRGERPDPQPYLQRVPQSESGVFLCSPEYPAHFAQDVELAMALDRFDFAMRVQRQENQLVLLPVPSLDA